MSYDFNGRVPRDMFVNNLSAINSSITRLSVVQLTDEENNGNDNKMKQSGTRTFSGYGNNQQNSSFGASKQPLLRRAGTDYSTNSGLAVRGSTPAQSPNPRVVSNLICNQVGSIPSTARLTDMAWVWGQFVDHEVDLTPSQSGDAAESAPMHTEATDPNEQYPGRVIPFTRSQYTIIGSTRQQPNNISAFVDGTNVYGFSDERALALRLLDGSGKLKTSVAANGEVVLPFNTSLPPQPNDNGPHGAPPSSMFLAGDVRANENAYLTSMHALWVREHNRLCDELAPKLENANDETIFQAARAHVIGYMQAITYNEFLPALLGPRAPGAYTGYSPAVNAGVTTEFSTVGYRVGHTMLSSSLNAGALGTVLLRDIFFTPSAVGTNGISQYIKGAASKRCQQIDGKIVDDVRNLLFGAPTSTMMHDLAAINMQRARDHGIPGYNTLRVAYGLPAVASFADMPTSAQNRTWLASLYESPEYVDPWLGAIIETHLPGAAVGPLCAEIIADQFDRLRRGDRYYYLNDTALSDEQKSEISATSLADIVRRNCPNISVQDDVFHV